MSPYIRTQDSISGQADFLALPISIRQSIYTHVIRSLPKDEQYGYSPLSYTCRQIQAEFTEHQECLTDKSFRCCLGRSWVDRDTTKFYTWNYNTAAWGTSIELTPRFVERLKKCVVRCTIEEMSDWERRSESGSDCFKDCIRILVRTFKTCNKMRELKTSFDHFVMSHKNGLLGPDEIWSRLKKLTGLPGLEVIRFETPGFEENYVWVKERRGKVDFEWIKKFGENLSAWSSHKSQYAPRTGCGVNAPKGYGFRRGIT